MMIAGKVAPATAAGCVCVCKPAEQTPLTALYFAQLTKEVSEPRTQWAYLREVYKWGMLRR